ncbi:hypothetical protein BDV37DRAFT_280983 [Aspergillus pseudonomiae]|uniref:RmlC-like cupin domain-containing protein n=1 Tax=Aspergillus pseudonomiae TaxID=1506151 RepID=A0A5N7DJ74_9EURO|nr:uncharacterized protein BDV37DRAFT_280983 [Aspergillus pseudonomiae]KAE8406394.1 hypothetical protein BDV37DRAFT_280983 [Aspergillus pseudonomiae]
MVIARSIKQYFSSVEVSEGAGSRVHRALPTPKLHNLTPFVMLDHVASEANKIGNFPDHPHRGQEIISYILSGALDHEDFLGNKGTIGPGDLQFMSAGRGIMHAEQPRRNDPVNDREDSIIEALQLWIDLPKEFKYSTPQYRDVRAKEIPVVHVDEGRVVIRIIAGESHGVVSKQNLAYTPIWYLDVTVKPGGHFQQTLPNAWNAFVYILRGRVTFTSSSSDKSMSLGRFHVVVFEQNGDFIEASVSANADENARFIIFAGQPLDQEIVHYGPFVLSSLGEVYQAVEDFRKGKNGFERALTWKSEIQRRLDC